jgi:hypothetical protein
VPGNRNGGTYFIIHFVRFARKAMHEFPVRIGTSFFAKSFGNLFHSVQVSLKTEQKVRANLVALEILQPLRFLGFLTHRYPCGRCEYMIDKKRQAAYQVSVTTTSAP